MSSVYNNFSVYSYNPEIYKPKFDILETDNEGMKQAKKLWNSSNNESSPHYMGGIEKRKILKIHYKELEELKQIWGDKGKDDPELFFIYNKPEEENTQQHRVVQENSLEDKTSVKFHIKKALIIVAVASFAIIFFAKVLPEISIITIPTISLLASAALYEVYAHYRGDIVISDFI
jgi:hypothetical protein